MSNTQKMIDDILNPNDTNWKPIIKTAGWIIYYLSLIYAGSHVFTWVKGTLDGTFLILGYIGAVGIIANAGVLPHAIEQWTFDKVHRAVAILFYVVDIIIMGGFVASHINSILGTDLESLNNFLTYIAPFQFLVPIVTWGTLTIMDPENLLKYEIRREMEKAEIMKIRGEAAAEVIKAKQYSKKVIEDAGLDPDKAPKPEIIHQNGDSKKARSR